MLEWSVTTSSGVVAAQVVVEQLAALGLRELGGEHRALVDAPVEVDARRGSKGSPGRRRRGRPSRRRRSARARARRAPGRAAATRRTAATSGPRAAGPEAAASGPGRRGLGDAPIVAPPDSASTAGTGSRPESVSSSAGVGSPSVSSVDRRHRPGLVDPPAISKQDDGDVVLAAALVRRRDERLRRAAQVAAMLLDRLEDRLVVDHRRQAVGAEQEHVAVPRLDRERVDVDVRVGAERPRDHRALRVRLGLLGRELPLRTSSATSEWSSVSCSSAPSRTR